jgi:hypothetical protein
MGPVGSPIAPMGVQIAGALDATGLDEVSRDDLAELLRVDVGGWLADRPLIAE